MAVIRCLMCGEFAESDLGDCPGCGVTLPSPPQDSRPASPPSQKRARQNRTKRSTEWRPRATIPHTQQEARRDGSTSNFIMCLLGLMVMVPAATILSELLFIPWAVSCLIVFFSLLTAAYAMRPEQQSGEEFVESMAGSMTTVSIFILKAAAAIVAVISILVVGCVVLMFVACFS